mmetsp:Transcript_65530/g.152195  ORF Transcript_65530/g.152195 Transcript_65530/m.152195 type:complete len:204 (-) Transcript_65530:77-688(-)
MQPWRGASARSRTARGPGRSTALSLAARSRAWSPCATTVPSGTLSPAAAHPSATISNARTKRRSRSRAALADHGGFQKARGTAPTCTSLQASYLLMTWLASQRAMAITRSSARLVAWSPTVPRTMTPVSPSISGSTTPMLKVIRSELQPCLLGSTSITPVSLRSMTRLVKGHNRKLAQPPCNPTQRTAMIMHLGCRRGFPRRC